MLTTVIAAALAVTPPSFTCPRGNQLRTWDEATQLTRSCEKTMVNGQVLPDGPLLVWEKAGRRRQEGHYKEGRRAGTWTWWRADGKRELVATFGDEDNTLQMISDPDEPWRRVQDFGPDRLTSKINGERVTALGEDSRKASRYTGAPHRAVAQVVAIYNAVGVDKDETCCLVEDGKTANARKNSVARYMLKVLDATIPQVALVCATLEVRVDFKIGDIVYVALEPSGEGKTDCGGGLRADAFVAAMSYRKDSAPVAAHNLKLLLEDARR